MVKTNRAKPLRTQIKWCSWTSIVEMEIAIAQMREHVMAVFPNRFPMIHAIVKAYETCKDGA
jgi:cell division protein YceG involved in septum cleavage